MSTRTTTDPTTVSTLCDEDAPDLILLDLMMPNMDGYETMTRIREGAGQRVFLPILVLTADLTDEARTRALANGATDFLTKPFSVVEAMLRIKNLLVTRKLSVDQQLASNVLEWKVSQRTVELESARNGLLDALGRAAEFRDDDTGQHTRRVGVIAQLMAERFGLEAATADLIGRTAPLHDIGKIGIPDPILLKPGRLTSDEYEVVKRHSTLGVQIVGDDPHALFLMARTIIRSHHERFDGGGYPDGLVGEAIPLPARLVAVADVWDALTHVRPYKEAWPDDRALTEIRDNSGTQFDPQMVDLFLSVRDNDWSARDNVKDHVAP